MANIKYELRDIGFKQKMMVEATKNNIMQGVPPGDPEQLAIEALETCTRDKPYGKSMIAQQSFLGKPESKVKSETAEEQIPEKKDKPKL